MTKGAGAERIQKRTLRGTPETPFHFFLDSRLPATVLDFLLASPFKCMVYAERAKRDWGLPDLSPRGATIAPFEPRKVESLA